MTGRRRRSNWEPRPVALVLAGRLRACWHILRGRRVMYHVNVSGGEWSDRGWQRDLVFVDCWFAPGFKVNGRPCVELQGRFGDVRAKSEPIPGFRSLP